MHELEAELNGWVIKVVQGERQIVHNQSIDDDTLDDDDDSSKSDTDIDIATKKKTQSNDDDE